MTREERAAMAIDMYHIHIHAARENIAAAAEERRNRDRAAAVYFLDNVAFHRVAAAGWLKRYKRAHSKMIAAEASL